MFTTTCDIVQIFNAYFNERFKTSKEFSIVLFRKSNKNELIYILPKHLE